MNPQLVTFPQFSTARTQIALAQPRFAEQVLQFQLRNAEHLKPWEPLKSAGFYELDNTKARLEIMRDHFIAGSACHFIAFTPEQDSILGLANFTQIARGAFQACYLGYSMDEQAQNTGLMTEILSCLLEYMFTQQKLHRVMANYLPSNLASARVLEKLGFEKEGYAKDYLNIAGQWQDHILTAKCSPIANND